eukprot:gene28428-32110_t
MPSFKPTPVPTVTRTVAPTQDPAAPVLTVAITAKSRNTYTVAASFSTATFAGTVYCAAFANGATVTSASEVLVSGAKVNYLSGATTATMVIPSLKAVTDYDVYCAAVTVNGVANTDSAVLATKQDATTDCCNLLTYTNAPSYVYGSLTKYATTSAVPVFAYTLSAAPRSFVVITPVVRNATGQVVPSSVLTVQPAMVNFTSSSNLVGRFILSGSALLDGVFTIELKASGTSSADYESNIFTTTH